MPGSESPKNENPPQNTPKSPEPPEPEASKQLNGTLAKPSCDSLKVDSNYNSVKEPVASEYEKPKAETAVEPKREETRRVNKTPTHERRASRTIIDSEMVEKRRLSIKTEPLPEQEEVVCPRRVSIPTSRTTPKRKPECGTHVVAKSELWDTGSQHRCKSHQKSSRVSISQDEESNHMHRTVSERNRHSSQKEKREKSPVAKKEMTTNICNQQCNKLGYFQSTPNVAAIKAASQPPKRDKSMYNATSESELLDREILPIFQKLLTERNKSQHNIDYSFGRSCPNISIKCDIVEYL